MDDPSLLVFCYRELLATVKYRVWSPGTGQSYLRLIWLQKILRPVSGLGDMTGIPYHTSQQPVIGAGLDWRDNKFCHHVRPGVSHLTNDNCSVNTAPRRLLAQGEESFNVKICVSPTGPQ